MKKRIILPVIFTVCITGVFAQNQVIKVNPAGYFFGSANISYEYAAAWPFKSVQLNLNYGGLSAPGVKYTGIGANFDGRYYFLKNKKTKGTPRGLYYSAGLTFTYISVTVDGKNSKGAPATGLKMSLGYQWIWDNGFTIDLFGGYNYNFYTLEYSGVNYNKYQHLPVVGLALGYGFGKDD